MKHQARLLAASPSESEIQIFAVFGPKTGVNLGNSMQQVRVLGDKAPIEKAFAQLVGLDEAVPGRWNDNLNKVRDADLEIDQTDGKLQIKVLPHGKAVDFSAFTTADGDQRDLADKVPTLDSTKPMPGEDENQDKNHGEAQTDGNPVA